MGITPNGERARWLLTREKILMTAGLILIGATFVVFVITKGEVFQFEFLLCGLALCGISIMGWGDKK